MPKETPNLNLYKIDPETDGEMSFNVETMLNENWDKVDEGFQELKENLTAQRTDYVRQPAYAVTGGTGNAYTVSTTPAPTAYVDGMGVIIRANRANTGAATLNWNGLGAIPIVDAKGRALIADKIPNGARLSLRYSSAAANFQLQGEGGEYGTATPAEVMQGYTLGTEEGVVTGTLALSGNATAGDVVSGQTFYSTNPKSKITGTLTLSGNAAAGDVIAGQTFYNTNPKIKATGTLALSGDAATANVLTGKTFYSTNPKTKLTGAMPNRGSVTNTITTQGGQYTIPAGYHSGSGKVTASFANLTPANIKKGVNIGGVVGILEDDFKELVFAFSQDWVVPFTGYVDVFLVGGGGGGALVYSSDYIGGGGGGGYTKTFFNIAVTKNEVIPIRVGIGGMGGIEFESYGADGSSGGFSQFKNSNYSVSGGQGGKESIRGLVATGGNGGSGGSGSSSWRDEGGKDGGNGKNDSEYDNLGGIGQGLTTRKWGDPSGVLFSSGGHGIDGNSKNPVIGTNGMPGKGDGGSAGRTGYYNDEGSVGGSGGSGIVIVRKSN